MRIRIYSITPGYLHHIKGQVYYYDGIKYQIKREYDSFESAVMDAKKLQTSRFPYYNNLLVSDMESQKMQLISCVNS